MNLDSVVVSRIDQIIIVIYQTQKSTGSSYIPTPTPYSNARCGLNNVQNDGDKCFYWCVKYHSTAKEKHYDRVSVLKKLEDKYNFEGVDYPASYDDIKVFEENNKVGVVVYGMDEEKAIVKEYHGNKDYLLNDRIYLLRIGNETKSHYVYI